MGVWLDRSLSEADRLDLVHDLNTRLAELPADPEVQRVYASGLVVEADCVRGSGAPWREMVEAAMAIEETVPPTLVMEGAEAVLAIDAIVGDRHDEARERLTRLIGRAGELADDVSLPALLEQLSWLEYSAGNWDRSDELAEESASAAAGQGQQWEHLARLTRAETQGLRGDVTQALETIDSLHDQVASPLSPWPITDWWSSRSQVLLAAGRLEEAYDGFAHTRQECVRLGWDDPAMYHADTAHLECAVALGHLDEVVQGLPDVEARARRAERPAVLAECSRIRILLAAATGDLDTATAQIPSMLERYESGVPALHRAHAFLTAGRVYRRSKAKTKAHEALRRAVGYYEQLGARPYAEQAAAELARVGLRPRASGLLTDTERQAATLAAEGLRNREIAERLFVSPKTVEAILGRAYRKLGIRSRAELGRALAQDTTQGSPGV